MRNIKLPLPALDTGIDMIYMACLSGKTRGALVQFSHVPRWEAKLSCGLCSVNNEESRKSKAKIES